MKLVIAGTGASGAIYLQRLLDQIDASEHEVHLVLSAHGKQVIAEELGELLIPSGVHQQADRTMNVPFVSGSARLDAMVVVPCSMGTVARIAHGISDSLLTRAADVMLKERRTLIVVPRETPLSLVHLENLTTLARAGALVLPAMPSFYGKPESVGEVVDTIVARVMDHLGLAAAFATRWHGAPSASRRPAPPSGDA